MKNYHRNFALKLLSEPYLYYFILLFFLSTSSCGFSQTKCGTERWDVKTLSDRDTIKINFNKKIPTTVHQQAGLPKPAYIAEDSPRLSDETTLYVLDCLLLGYKKEKDKDIHIVIRDLNTFETMVAEIPSADCRQVQMTGRYMEIARLNQWFELHIGKPSTKYRFLTNPIRVEITGVGFYDFLHGQKGMAANGREIHPVLEMSFR